MATKPETRIVEAIIKAVRLAGGFAIHTPGSIKQANQPDIDGSIPGHQGEPIHFKVEVKLPGEQARPAQAAMLDVWRQHGYVVGTVHSVDEFLDLIYFATQGQRRKNGNTRQIPAQRPTPEK